MTNILEQELHDWNINAEFYLHDYDSAFQRVLNENKLKVYDLSNEGKKVLDIGCGVGHIDGYLKEEYNKEVIGIDFSGKMIELAQKKYKDIEFINISAEKLPFKNNTFDVVICDGVLHHLKVQGILEISISEIYRVLKPSGVLCVFDRNGSFLSGLLLKIALFGKKVFGLTKKEYPSSATKNEVPFGNKDIVKYIDNIFKIENKCNVSSAPFFIMVVITNTIEYIFGKVLSDRIRSVLVKVVCKAEEKMQKYDWFYVEQCLRLRKAL